MSKVIQILADLLRALFSKRVAVDKKQLPIDSARITAAEPVKMDSERKEVPVDEPSPVLENAKVEPPSRQFLICPIQENDANGKLLTSRTAKITAVIDHAGTAIDANSTKTWGLNAKDQRVKAFNGEVGDGESSAGAPYGYAKKSPTPFFSAGEINYVGAPGPGDKHGPTFYLNYDGHAGYDFKCGEGTPIIAPAGGNLYKAQADPIDGVNRNWCLKNLGINNPTAWQGWHTFYIKHPNGYSTWFLHCTKLVDEIESQLVDYQKCAPVRQGQLIAYSGKYGGVPPHLHFEVRNDKDSIVDPYGDQLWET